MGVSGDSRQFGLGWLVVGGWVVGELVGVCVDDADVLVGDEEFDSSSCVGCADVDVVWSAVVAEGHSSAFWSTLSWRRRKWVVGSAPVAGLVLILVL